MRIIVFLISFVQMILALGYTISYTIISIYLYRKNLSPSLIGIITGISTLFGILGWFPAGKLNTKLGEKQLLLLSLFLRASAFLFMGFNIYFDFSLIFFVILLFTNTFLMGLNVTPLESYLIHYTEKLNQNMVFSIYRTALNAGWAMGPLIGGYVAKWNYAFPFLFTSLFFFIAFVIVLLLFPNKKREENIKKFYKENISIFKNIPFLFFSINTLNLFITMSLLITPLSVFLLHNYSVDSSDIGHLFFINGLMVVFLQIPISLYVKNIYLSVQMGLLLYFLGYLSVGVFSLFFDFYWIYVSMIMITMGEILSVSGVYTISVMYAKNYPTKIQSGYVSSSMGFFRTIGWAIGPMIAGGIQEAFQQSPLLIWILSGSFAIFGIVFNIILYYKFPLDFHSTDS